MSCATFSLPISNVPPPMLEALVSILTHLKLFLSERYVSVPSNLTTVPVLIDLVVDPMMAY